MSTGICYYMKTKQYFFSLELPLIITKQFKKKNDAHIQEYVCNRDKICLLFGHRADCMRSYTSGHHLIKRRYLLSRWHPYNVFGLCPSCHTWADENETEAEEMIIMSAIMRCIINNENDFYNLKQRAIR